MYDPWGQACDLLKGNKLDAILSSKGDRRTKRKRRAERKTRKRFKSGQKKFWKEGLTGPVYMPATLTAKQEDDLKAKIGKQANIGTAAMKQRIKPIKAGSADTSELVKYGKAKLKDFAKEVKDPKHIDAILTALKGSKVTDRRRAAVVTPLKKLTEASEKGAARGSHPSQLPGRM